MNTKTIYHYIKKEYELIKKRLNIDDFIMNVIIFILVLLIYFLMAYLFVISMIEFYYELLFLIHLNQKNISLMVENLIVIKIFLTFLLFYLLFYLIHNYIHDQTISIKKNIAILITHVVYSVITFKLPFNPINLILFYVWNLSFLISIYFSIYHFNIRKKEIQIELEEIEKKIMV